MLDPREWTEDYLLNLPIGEFDWLEVKGRRGLDLTLPTVKENSVRENLSKAISAFANSGGGNLVFGLCDPNQKWQVDDGGVDLFVKSLSTREWLEDIIPTCVDAPLSSFNVYCIQRTNADSQILEGRGIFIVNIPDSFRAPHQAIDNKYYARVGGKSRPIGHRLVTDIFNRRQHPIIQLEFSILSIFYTATDYTNLYGVSTHGPMGNLKQDEPKRLRYDLSIVARNVGSVLAQYVNCDIYIPVALVPQDNLERDYANGDVEEIDGAEYVVWSKRNTRRDLIKGGTSLISSSEYGPSWFDPILPKLYHSWTWDIVSNFNEINWSDEKIIWEVFADSAPVQSGEIQVADIAVEEVKRS